jgi:hypothetical protein
MDRADNNILSRLPLAVSDFSDLRKKNCIYVDKTVDIYSLASQTGHFFMLRPDGFGKTFLLSTFESLFKYGLRDFQGTAMEYIWHDPNHYLVVKLNFAHIADAADGRSFSEVFAEYVGSKFRDLGFRIRPEFPYVSFLDHLGIFFSEMQQNSLVLLIDNFDAPLKAAKDNEALYKEIHEQLSLFATYLTSYDRVIRFLFVTGLDRLTNGGIFNELKGFEDLSENPRYSELLGFTEEEVIKNFGECIGEICSVYRTSPEVFMEEVKKRLGRYSFAGEEGAKVFPPTPLLQLLADPAELGLPAKIAV